MKIRIIWISRDPDFRPDLKNTVQNTDHTGPQYAYFLDIRHSQFSIKSTIIKYTIIKYTNQIHNNKIHYNKIHNDKIHNDQIHNNQIY